ncbi:MAG: hypothetical protein RLZZ381_1541 [Cyanobacteriota bacterium]|jgi:hypothetical protein
MNAFYLTFIFLYSEIALYLMITFSIKIVALANQKASLIDIANKIKITVEGLR